MQLACRVEIARTVAEGGGDPEGIANGEAGVEEKLFVLSDAGDIGEEGHVVARIDRAEEGMQGAVQGAFGACAGKGFIVAVERDAIGEDGARLREVCPSFSNVSSRRWVLSLPSQMLGSS